VLGRRAIVMTVAAAAVVAACTGGGSSQSLRPTTTVAASTTTEAPRGNVDGQLNIGVLLPSSGNGPGQLLGDSMSTAVMMAVQEINATGGVNGSPVVLSMADEGTTQEEAAKGLDDLVHQKKVDAVIGPASSKVALALVDKIADDKVVTCSPTATSNALSTYPNRGYFFRTMPSDALEAKVLGEVIAETGRQSTAIINPDDQYGRDFARQLATTLREEDTQVPAVTSYDATAKDISAVVTTALQDHPASVAVIGPADAGGKIIAGLEAAGTSPKSIFVTDGMREADLFDQVEPGHPESVSGIQGTSPSTVSPNAWFNDAFNAYAPGAQNLYAAYAYDCANLIALAAQTARTDDPTVFVADMAPTSRNGVSCRNFTDCAPILADGRNIDLNGASGRIDLLENGDASYGTYDVWMFGDDGKDQPIKTKTESLP
jgi:branched-chain amino acid transport system substrate-binding protein